MTHNTTPTKRYTRRRGGCIRFALGALVLGLFVVNGLAWTHARAMTHFVQGGPQYRTETLRTLPPADLLRVLTLGVPLPRPQNSETPADHYLPYELLSVPVAGGEQLESWLIMHPQPRAIVLAFPGYAGAKEGLLTPAAHFYQWGYSALLVDFRGSGGSSRSDTTLGIREASDVAAAVAFVRGRWPELPVVLYGVSMGGAAIIRAIAVEGVRPQAIIVEGVFDRLLTTTRHRFDAVGMPSFPAAELLLFWGGVQMGYNGFANNPIEHAPAITCPTLMLYGANDPWIHADEAHALAQQVAGPLQLVEVPDMGHQMPFVYGAPERWAQNVRQFLDSAQF